MKKKVRDALKLVTDYGRFSHSRGELTVDFGHGLGPQANTTPA